MSNAIDRLRQRRRVALAHQAPPQTPPQVADTQRNVEILKQVIEWLKTRNVGAKR